MRDGNIRAKLKPVRKKGGWVARGFVPVKQADGSIARARVERGLGADLSKAEREAQCDRLNRFYEERATSTIRPMTFAKALSNYLQSGKPQPLHAECILHAIGIMPCSQIDDSVMLGAIPQVLPGVSKPSTINRHLYTPVSAILRMASKSGACAPPNLTRPVGHKLSPPIAIPDQDWWEAVLPQLTPTIHALVALLTVHGRRLGDVLNRTAAYFDAVAQTLLVGRTKTGEPLLVDLLPSVADLMSAMPDWRHRKWLFGSGPTGGSNVRREILVACLKAANLPRSIIDKEGSTADAKAALRAVGMKYYHPHSIGRHSFATRLLRSGYSLQYVKDAGGWKSVEMVSQRYGHLSHQETTAAVHKVGGAWADNMLGGGGKVGAAASPSVGFNPEIPEKTDISADQLRFDLPPPKAKVVGSNPTGRAISEQKCEQLDRQRLQP